MATAVPKEPAPTTDARLIGCRIGGNLPTGLGVWQAGNGSGMARMLCIAAVAAVLLAGCGGGGSDEKSAASTKPAASAAARDDFLGIYADDVFFGTAVYKEMVLPEQHRAGIRLIRQPFAWDAFEKDP